MNHLTARTQRISTALILPVVILALAGCSQPAQTTEEIIQSVTSQLDEISSYKMDIEYAETLTGSDGSAMESQTQTRLQYLEPDFLRIDAKGVFEGPQGTSGLTIHTTFENGKQKARFSQASKNYSTTNSIVFDTSENAKDAPFQGWNLSGFGILEGKDYIQTIRTMLTYSDFEKSDSDGSTTTLTGTPNIERLTALLSKTLPADLARSSAKRVTTSIESLSLHVDTQRNLVIGFTQLEKMGDSDLIRSARFKDVEINPRISPSEFIFNELPDEVFTDITENLRKARALSTPPQNAGKR